MKFSIPAEYCLEDSRNRKETTVELAKINIRSKDIICRSFDSLFDFSKFKKDFPELRIINVKEFFHIQGMGDDIPNESYRNIWKKISNRIGVLDIKSASLYDVRILEDVRSLLKLDLKKDKFRNYFTVENIFNPNGSLEVINNTKNSKGIFIPNKKMSFNPKVQLFNFDTIFGSSRIRFSSAQSKNMHNALGNFLTVLAIESIKPVTSKIIDLIGGQGSFLVSDRKTNLFLKEDKNYLGNSLEIAPFVSR